MDFIPSFASTNQHLEILLKPYSEREVCVSTKHHGMVTQARQYSYNKHKTHKMLLLDEIKMAIIEYALSPCDAQTLRQNFENCEMMHKCKAAQFVSKEYVQK
jgi:hypothetical protein